MRWTDRASQVMSFAEREASPLAVRQRIFNAIEAREPRRWMHFRLSVDTDDLERLILPGQFFAVAQADRVRAAAEEIAEAMRAEAVEVGHLAAAIGVTARDCSSATLRDLGESFDLPSMPIQDWDALRKHVVGKLLEPELSSEPSDSPIGFASSTARRLEVSCRVASMSVRVVAAILLAAAALWGRGWWLLFFAVAVLFSTQPQHRAELLLLDESRPLVRASRFPWLPVCALLLCLMSRPQEAAIVTVAWVVSRSYSHLGELAVARGMAVINIRKQPPVFTFIRPAAVFVMRNRALDGCIALAGGASTALVLIAVHPSSEVSTVLGAALLTTALVEGSAGQWRWIVGPLRVLALTAAVVLGWDAWPVLWVVPLAGSAAMYLLRVNHRPVLPSLAAGQDRREKAIWSDLAKGKSQAVLDALQREPRLNPRLRAALAVAHVAAGHPGQARQLAADLPDTVLPIRQLIEAQVHYLLGTRPLGGVGEPDLSTHIGRVTELARLRALIPFTDPLHNAMSIAALIPRTITRSSAVFAADCYLAVGEALRGARDDVALASMSRSYALLDLFLTQDRDFLSRETLEVRMLENPGIHQMGATTIALMNLGFAADEESPGSSLVEDGALGVLTESGSPFLIAKYCNGAADLIRDIRGHSTDDSLALRAQGFAVLNAVRHKLTNEADRTVWWETFAPTLETLLRECHDRGNWPLLLETIEAARLQLGVSRDDLRPTALRIAGSSTLGDARFFFGQRPSVRDLEDVMHSAGGQDALWWSTHLTSDALYWATATGSPNAAVDGGRIPIAEVHDALNALAPHLSVQGEHEDDDDYLERLESSALLAPPSRTEEGLSEKIGHLLPPAITKLAALRHRRTAICLSLAPELALVPWAWVSAGPWRLVELFDTIIVPPASLVPPPDMGDRRPTPIAVAVVDPGADLDAAAATAQLLPKDCARVDAATPARRDALSQVLQTTAYDATLFLACHTVTIGGRRGFALAPIDDIDSADVLFAWEIAGDGTDYPMPRQVVALACASSELTVAQRGEWTVLGTALIQAGARRALVTAFPIPDLREVDAHVVDGIADGTPLHVVISSLQLQMLDRWRQGDLTAAPLMWAGLQLFGTLPVDQSITPRRRPAWAEKNLIEGIDSAAELGQPGAQSVDLRDLMSYFAIYGHCEGLPRRAQAAVRRRFTTRWPPPLHHFGYIRNYKRLDHTPRLLSDDLLEVIADAREVAHQAGQSVYDIDHVFAAALRSQHPDCVAMRDLTGFDTRNPAVVQRFVEDDREDYHHTGVAQAPHLAPGESERIYDLLGVHPPAGEDEWFHTDRLP